MTAYSSNLSIKVVAIGNLAGREPKIRGVLLRNGGKAMRSAPNSSCACVHLLIGDFLRQQHLGEAIFTAVFDGGKPHQAAKRLVDGDEQRPEMPAETMSLPSSA